MTSTGSTGDQNNSLQVKVHFNDGYLEHKYIDPRKTPTWRFYTYIAIIAASCFLTSSFASAYLYIAPAVQKEFAVSAIEARLPFTLYVLAWGLGPLFFSPICDLYGRRKTFLLSQFFWTTFHIGSARSTNIATLIVTRFLAGLLGSASLTCGAQLATDVAEGMTVVKAVSGYCTIVFLGPVLGPLIGSSVAEFALPIVFSDGGWRWVFYAAIMSGTVLFLVILIVLPETNATVLLRKKAEELEKIGIEVQKIAAQEKDSSKFKLILSDVCLMLSREPIVIFIGVWQTSVMGVLYLFFEAFPVVYGDNHHFSTFQVGLSFIGIGVGMLLSCVYSITVDMKIYLKMVIANDGVREPEMRTGVAILSACLIAISLFWFGFTTSASIPWVVSVIASIFYGIAAMSVMLSTFFYIVDVYATRAGAAYAATGLIRSVTTSFFPLFGASMFRGLGPQKACLVLACISVVEIAIPVTARYFGKSIRQFSRLAAKK